MERIFWKAHTFFDVVLFVSNSPHHSTNTASIATTFLPSLVVFLLGVGGGRLSLFPTQADGRGEDPNKTTEKKGEPPLLYIISTVQALGTDRLIHISIRVHRGEPVPQLFYISTTVHSICGSSQENVYLGSRRKRNRICRL